MRRNAAEEIMLTSRNAVNRISGTQVIWIARLTFKNMHQSTTYRNPWITLFYN